MAAAYHLGRDHGIGAVVLEAGPIAWGASSRNGGFVIVQVKRLAKRGTLPARAARPERPVRVGLAFLALREDAHVLLRRRPEAGLLGGMFEVPSTEWAETLPPLKEVLRIAPVRADWWAVPGIVAHTFTHFRLETLVYRAIVSADASLTFWADPQRCRWVARRELDRAALPSVMRKIIAHGLKES